ncbi:MAG TPA: hypothetical protein VIL48_20875 [Acidimicrobiales bacterium]
MSVHDPSAPSAPPSRPAPSASPARRLAAVAGSVAVVAVTVLALGLGLLSPMASDSCGPESTEPECVNEGTYTTLLTLGPVALGAAALVAVWFRARGRPRPEWLVPWAVLLAAVLATGNALAGGKVL